MSIENRSGVVLMLPFKSGTIDSLDDFYHEIGWNIVEEDARQFLTTAIAPIEADNGPSITYWHTHIFEQPGDDNEEQRIYTPGLQRLVEVSLVVPTNRDVEHLLKLGGRALQKNIYEFPDRSSDSLSFRFTDPFNYLLGIRSASKVEAATVAPASNYVSTFTKWETDETVSVITEKSLVDFAVNRGNSTMIAHRAFRGIVQAAMYDPQVFEEFLERSEGKVMGLNANKIKDLVNVIAVSRRDRYVRNFGPKASEVLENLADELYPDD